VYSVGEISRQESPGDEEENEEKRQKREREESDWTTESKEEGS